MPNSFFKHVFRATGHANSLHRRTVLRRGRKRNFRESFRIESSFGERAKRTREGLRARREAVRVSLVRDFSNSFSEESRDERARRIEASTPFQLRSLYCRARAECLCSSLCRHRRGALRGRRRSARLPSAPAARRLRVVPGRRRRASRSRAGAALRCASRPPSAR